MHYARPIAAAALLAGCATMSTPPTVAGCRTWEQQADAPRPMAVSILSPELARIIGVEEVSTRRTATGTAAVQAQVRNCTDVDVVLLIRTRFLAERGPSEPPSAWRTVHMPPRASAIYQESSLSPGSGQAFIDIHDANRGQSQFAPHQSYTHPIPSPR